MGQTLPGEGFLGSPWVTGPHAPPELLDLVVLLEITTEFFTY